MERKAELIVSYTVDTTERIGINIGKALLNYFPDAEKRKLDILLFEIEAYLFSHSFVVIQKMYKAPTHEKCKEVIDELFGLIKTAYRNTKSEEDLGIIAAMRTQDYEDHENEFDIFVHNAISSWHTGYIKALPSFDFPNAIDDFIVRSALLKGIQKHLISFVQKLNEIIDVIADIDEDTLRETLYGKPKKKWQFWR